MFSAHPEELTLAHDPELGFSLVGPCARSKAGPYWLRAVDIENRRIGWDSPPLPDAEVPSRREIAVRGRLVYLAHRKTLTAIDLLTGKERWRGALDEAAEWSPGRGPAGGCPVADPSPAGEPGAIVVPTVDRGLAAFDRASGKALWKRTYERRARIVAVEQTDAILVDLDGRFEILRVLGGEVALSVGGLDGARVLRVSMEGRCAVAFVQGWGPSKREGVLVADAKTGEVLSFDDAPAVQARCAPASGGGRVYVALGGGLGDRVGFVPGTRSRPLGEDGASVVALRMAGSTLFAVLRVAGARRVIALDARKLDAQFELTDVGGMPDGTAEEQLQVEGRVVALVSNPRKDWRRCELRVLDGDTGEVRWRREIGEWCAHYFLGGKLVVVTRGRLEITEPGTGRAAATYPFSQPSPGLLAKRRE